MGFTLNGFVQERQIRHYSFHLVGKDKIRTEFSVDADVDLLRNCGISLQDLPLLLLQFLEKQNPDTDTRAFIFSEALMREHADECLAAKRAAGERKKTRRPLSQVRAVDAWHPGS